MNEVMIRFDIIKLAVEIADHDTIIMQSQKLKDTSVIEEIKEITVLLESKNYRQAIFLIEEYINLLDDSASIKQTSSAAKKQPASEYESRFHVTQPYHTTKLNVDDMIQMTQESAKKSIVYDSHKTDTDDYAIQLRHEVEKSQSKTNTPKTATQEDHDTDSKTYPCIPYINQKFKNMQYQFPQAQLLEADLIEEVKSFMDQIATSGYTDNDIKDIIALFKQKRAQDEPVKATQILLLAAATESEYAQLLLARELFRGEIFKVNYPEAFTQINRLAENGYLEAICDLAQLYEYGYGIKKNKKTALLLYKEAADTGLKRAHKHVKRLSMKHGILHSFFIR